MTIFGIPVGLVITVVMKLFNYVADQMKESDIRELVNNENYVRERGKLDVWLKEADKIFAESMAKTDEELDKSLDEDLTNATGER